MHFVVHIGGERLDVYLAQNTQFTRSKIKSLIDSGAVLLNGSKVKAGTILREQDSISIDYVLPPQNVVAENIPLSILFEDSDIIVVNKQSGLVVHPGGGAHSGTLANALVYHCNTLSSVDDTRPGIVHRLDKDTSGVMVVAKNNESHASLSKQIGEKSAVRIYYGLCEGNIKQDEGRIETNLVRHSVKRKEFVVCGANEGKQAITTFRVLQRFDGFTLAEFRLYTGRTHQIRVHAKHLGHPIVCDKVYGFSKQRFSNTPQLLHSRSLTFVHPKTGQELTFVADLPNYFSDILSKLKTFRH